MFLQSISFDIKVALGYESELNFLQKAVIDKTFWKEVLPATIQ